MKIKFEDLEKKCKECALEFLEELELLPVFLNYFPDVQEKWLKEIGLKSEEIKGIKEIIDKYAQKKVELENREKPQKREEVIKIEDKVLKKMYEGRVINLSHPKNEFILSYLKSKFPEAVVLEPKQLRKLELITLFKGHEKRFPMNYLVFDSKSKKIIGYEIIKKEL